MKEKKEKITINFLIACTDRSGIGLIHQSGIPDNGSDDVV